MQVSTPNCATQLPPRRVAHNRRVRKVVACQRAFHDPGSSFLVGDAGGSQAAEVRGHFYFLSGVNYSVKGVIDAYNTNALAEAYEYDPYGRHRVIDPGTDSTYFTSDDTFDEMHAGSINNSIRYTGQRFDAESNLMVGENRYYDAAAGRFIGRDPLGWQAGANRYGYVGGTPLWPVLEGTVLFGTAIDNLAIQPTKNTPLQGPPPSTAGPFWGRQHEWADHIMGL